MTEDSGEVWNSLPYLVSVSSPETAEDVPDYVTTVELSSEQFESAFRDAYPYISLDADPALWVEGTELDSSGRVASLRVGGQDIPGTEAREIFALRSTAFELEYSGGVFTFTVTGYGHGVGMSQYGANVMAGMGAGCEEILSHYYPGAELVG